MLGMITAFAVIADSIMSTLILSLGTTQTRLGRKRPTLEGKDKYSSTCSVSGPLCFHDRSLRADLPNLKTKTPRPKALYSNVAQGSRKGASKLKKRMSETA